MVQAAVAARSGDDAVHAGFAQRAHQCAARFAVAGDDLDHRPVRYIARQACEAERFTRRPFAVPAHLPCFDVRQRAGIARTESVEAIRVELAHIECAVNSTGQHGDDTARPGRACDEQSIEQVLRAVGLKRCGRAHRRDQHDRLGRRKHALQEIGGLLQRVGAVRDHDAANLRPRQVSIDRDHELAPDREAHVLAVDLRDLLDLDRRASRRGDRSHQLRRPELCRVVSNVVGCARRGARDRAASAEHDDERTADSRFVLHFSSSWMKIQVLDKTSAGSWKRAAVHPPSENP